MITTILAWIGVAIIQFIALVLSFASGKADMRDGSGHVEIRCSVAIAIVALICAWAIGGSK
ncbi:MAG TPA: hypothetical protein VFP33_06935 [Gallionella sp.]|nr:hypothetical protein [Gallionella sp.]